VAPASPMPRYWNKGCCEDVDHAPNWADAEFEQYLFAGLDGLRRHCKDFLFLHGHKNIKVLNSTQLMTETASGGQTLDEAVDSLRESWGDDPVNPGGGCYEAMAAKIISRTKENEGCNSGAVGHQLGAPLPKRARWVENPERNSLRPGDYGAGWRSSGRGGPMVRGGGRRGRGGRRGYARGGGAYAGAGGQRRIY